MYQGQDFGPSEAAQAGAQCRYGHGVDCVGLECGIQGDQAGLDVGEGAGVAPVVLGGQVDDGARATRASVVGAGWTDVHSLSEFILGGELVENDVPDLLAVGGVPVFAGMLPGWTGMGSLGVYWGALAILLLTSLVVRVLDLCMV